MFRDEEKITIENILQKENRKWKSSFMTPFGCNVMAVRYTCGYKSKKVSIYLNEVAIEMVVNGKKCTKCPLKAVATFLSSFVKDGWEDVKKENAKKISPEFIKSKREKEARKKKKKEEELEKKDLLEEEKLMEDEFDDEEEYNDDEDRLKIV